MDKEKEKINWKFVFAVAIPVSIIASIILSISFYLVSYENSGLARQEERERELEKMRDSNEGIISGFGDKMSATEVKNLINRIKSKNLIADKLNEGLCHIYIVLNGKEYSTEEVSKLIIQGKTYRVNTLNDNAIREYDFLESNEFILGDSQLGAGYYYNGYIRAISIEEVSDNEN